MLPSVQCMPCICEALGSIPSIIKYKLNNHKSTFYPSQKREGNVFHIPHSKRLRPKKINPPNNFRLALTSYHMSQNYAAQIKHRLSLLVRFYVS